MPLPRFAFVGSPRAASPWLLQALGRVGTLEAICDGEAERDVARYQARWAFSDLGALLKEAEPDGIVLEQPAAERAGVIKQCLASGVGVLLTGLPGSSPACKRLSSIASLAGRVLLAAPAIRFAPAVAVARRLLDSGKFGVPVSLAIQSSRRGAARAGPKDDGPVPVDQIFEAVDLVQHLLGPIQQVYAMAHAEGVLAANGATDGGVIVSFMFHASGAAETAGVRLELRAADGTVLRIDQDCRLACGNGSRVDAAHCISLATVDPAVELGYEGLAAEFRRHLEGGRGSPGMVGPVGAVVAASEAILASAARGRLMMPRQVGGEARTAVRGPSKATEGAGKE
jgi:predicted dehydrogenase